MAPGSFMGFLSRIVRLASIVAVVFILAGLLGFLTDSVRDTSKVQATRIPDPGSGRVVTVTIDITQPDPPAAIEKVRESEHTAAREFIDDVGDVLMSPFSWIIDGSDPWVQRLLYSLLALPLSGLLGEVRADSIRKSADGKRRAEATAREEAAAQERKRTGSYASPA